jgi:hypothetical protein
MLPATFSKINPSVRREARWDERQSPSASPHLISVVSLLSLPSPHRTSWWYSFSALMVISPPLAMEIAWAAALAAWTVVM